MLEIDRTYAPGYLLQVDVLMSRLGQRVMTGAPIKTELSFFKQSIALLEVGTSNTVGRYGHDSLLQKLADIRIFHDHIASQPDVKKGEILPPEPGVTPFKIMAKPYAQYTEEARSKGISGTIRLMLVLGADRRIKNQLILSRLGHGLDEKALAAARQITFEPKMVDGKPVPAIVTIEYLFNIY